MAPALSPPDRVIWLRASTTTLLERIAARGLAMERGITAGYLDRLGEAYAEYFARHPQLTVWTVDTEAVDLVRDGDAFEELVRRLEGETVSG
jgi:deoxyadenosine/deoxycytidine kinase